MEFQQAYSQLFELDFQTVLEVFCYLVRLLEHIFWGPGIVGTAIWVDVLDVIAFSPFVAVFIGSCKAFLYCDKLIHRFCLNRFGTFVLL